MCADLEVPAAAETPDKLTPKGGTNLLTVTPSFFLVSSSPLARIAGARSKVTRAGPRDRFILLTGGGEGTGARRPRSKRAITSPGPHNYIGCIIIILKCQHLGRPHT